MCNLMQKLTIFILYKSYALFSSFCIFNHVTIYQIHNDMISISTWDWVHFWIYLLNQNSLGHQTWPIDRYKQG